jgi:hypothetical protein
MADASEPDRQAVYQLDLKKAKESAENARAKVESAAQDMFQFYANLLAVDAKYAWNKNIQEQTQSDPCTDLQGVSKKGPRGLSRTVIDDCMMFHLLTVFPNNNNVTEQERYYLTNVLKKRQHVIVGQLVQRVEHSTPTLCSCHAGSTAQLSSPPQFPLMFHSPRLTWWTW